MSAPTDAWTYPRGEVASLFLRLTEAIGTTPVPRTVVIKAKENALDDVTLRFRRGEITKQAVEDAMLDLEIAWMTEKSRIQILLAQGARP